MKIFFELKEQINRIATDGTSSYFNYEGNNSILLLAIGDGDYSFSYIDIAYNGIASDGEVFDISNLAQALVINYLDIPEHI